MTHDEIRAYVKHGAIRAVKAIVERTGKGLHDSLEILNKARGESQVLQSAKEMDQ